MGSEKKTTLTEAWMRENAQSYVGIEVKRRFLSDCAIRCFDKMEIGTEDGESLPPFYKENAVSKSKYLLSALLTSYLHIRELNAEAEDPWELTDEEYDAYAAASPLSQLERIKKITGDKELRDKIYDLLADYRLLEKLLNSECYGLLPAMNDAISRFQMLMSAKTSPEAMEALTKNLEEMKAQVEALKENRALNFKQN